MHMRTQIRNAVKTALDAGVTWGTVHRGRVRPKPEPASEAAARAVNMTTIRDTGAEGYALGYGSVAREMVLEIEVTTQGADDGSGALEEAVDDGTVEVEKALVGNTLGGLLSGALVCEETEIETQAEADATTVVAVMTFGGTYTADATDPETGA